ncbi:MAG: DNA integrity scanning protein DisA nucleotide-binding domain protein [Clostridia bacterium]|nr:DNA integrity scanning protein DisA nucleotide-binding domain protein [Clostridia bacterium]
MGMNVLAATANFENIWNGILGFFNDFQVIFAVEIVLFFALIFFVSKVLRDNDATKLMLLYWLLTLVGGAMRIFDENLMSKGFFLFYVILISAFMLILFNVEVKKSLWDVHKSKENLAEKLLQGGGGEVRSQADTERCIANIIKALQNMSKNNVGALIVLSKGSLPKQVLQSGVTIDAEISTQLIEGIFFPKAPLHDGAMVINSHKIQAAGCFLPLTQKTSYPKEYGTRHRAGIGITEVANVISLIVSEETGIISIVRQGSVTRYADYDMLTDALKAYYWQEMPLVDRKRNIGGNK